MAKRKQPIETEKENRVSQVVEVVNEPQSSEAIETIKENAVEIEEAAEKLESALPENPETPVEQPNDEHEESEKQKEVVEDLFHDEASHVPVEITTVKNGSGKKLFIWAAIVVGVSILVGGVLIVATGGALPFTARPTPTPTPAPTPTPIPVASLDRKDLSIRVLNGGGVAGAAGKMKAFLEEKGYTVSGVGNTDEYTFDTTQIVVKKGKEGYLTLLKEDLKGGYSVSSTAATLDESSSFDAIITVGKE